MNVLEPEEIGARIKQAREKAGLRQEDLASLISVSTRQFQYYEAGASKPYSKLKAIAGATGVTVEWLLHGDPEPAANGGELEDLLRQVLPLLQTLVDERKAG